MCNNFSQLIKAKRRIKELEGLLFDASTQIEVLKAEAQRPRDFIKEK